MIDKSTRDQFIEMADYVLGIDYIYEAMKDNITYWGNDDEVLDDFIKKFKK